MQNQPVEYLLSQYVSGQITEKEWEELSAIMLDPENEQIIREKIAVLMLQSALEFQTFTDEEMGMPGSEGQVDMTVSDDQTSRRNQDTLHAMLQAIFSVDKTAGAAETAGSHATAGSHEIARSAEEVSSGNPDSGLRGSGGRLFLLRPVFLKWSAAAVLVVAVAVGGYRVLYKKQINTSIAANNVAVSSAGIVPGSNKAILTLAGGNQIVLTNAQNGVLSQQGNIKVIKLDNGKLSYQSDANRTEAARSGGGAANKGGLAYNTITTPRGGQYQIVLSDGTKVWLNAASSLKFPAVFGGDTRQVELSGEAYFEVAKDKNRPFKVLAGASLVEVLGTHFDIMAYGDEKVIRTTLLEGSVKMEKGKTETEGRLLQPGEQGALDINSGALSAREVNVRAAVAWKDGYYFFDRTSTEDVMRQIARWYDVEIIYQGAVPRDEIVGRIPRTANVSEVLHIMELIGIHFKIDGRKIIVL
jgi:transmembrane sensor